MSTRYSDDRMSVRAQALNVLLKKAEAQAKQESNVTVDQSLQSAS